MPERRRGKLEPDRLLAHDPKGLLLVARQEEAPLQVADVLHRNDAAERLVNERGCKVPAPVVRDEYPAFACELLHVIGDVLAQVEDVFNRTTCDCGPRRLEALAQE